jgi:cytochrome c553
MRLAVLLIVISAACGKNQDPPPATSGVPGAQRESGPAGWLATAPKDDPHAKPPAGGGKSPAQQAQDTYDMVCTMCHGADGRGKGPAAAQLLTKPRDYTDAAWQASITDDELKKTILLGGGGVGKNPQMPGQPQLEHEPEVLAELVKIIRAFKK